MTDEVLAERVKLTIINVLDLDLAPADLYDELPLYSSVIRLDSLTLLRIIAELEDVFSCEIDDEAIMLADLADVGSIVRLVASQLREVSDAI